MVEISEEFVKEQIKQLKQREDVKAVAVFGSYARDPDQEHNDLDIYIIVEGNWRKRVTKNIDGVVVEKFFNSMEWSKNYLKEAEEKENWTYPYRWFSNPDIRYDPEGLFEELKSEAEKFKEKRLNEDFDEEKFLYSIWDIQQDIETDDVAQKRFMMNKLFNLLLNKIYQLNNQIPVKDNYRVKKLQEFDGYMYKLAQDFLMSSSTMEKEQKLNKMIKHLTKSLGDPDPEWETEKQDSE